MRTSVAYAFLCVTAASANVTAQAKLEIQSDRENVVASRLLGEWQPDSSLTMRLGGSALAGATSGLEPRIGGPIVFKSDATVVDQIPARVVQGILQKAPGLVVFLTGQFRFGDREYPFMLASMNGNMHVVYFRERNGDRFGDGESFIVAVSPARDTMSDLLFVGGDFNNQPFSAFKRVTSASAAR